MRDLLKFFRRSYNRVSTRDCDVNDIKNLPDCNENRSQFVLNQGFSLVDSFFHERKTGERTRLPKCIFLLMSGGILAICAAIIMQILDPYDMMFKWKLVFEEGGEVFDLWQKPPVNLYVKIYLFNITNAEAFLEGREKMKVEEVGPYVYREMLLHDNIMFNENGTLSTIPRHPLVWQQEMSGDRREDDVVVMPHIALLSIAQVTSEEPFYVRIPINSVISGSNSQPIVRMTAKEFMFGYESTLTTLGNTFMPNWIYFEKVGLVDRMYDFNGDFETHMTGKGDPKLSGLYDTFRGSKHLPHWHEDHCNNIHLASDGTKFRSYIQPNDTLKFFRKNMCRPITIVRADNEVKKISGLDAFTFKFPPNSLDNGQFDERNKCFCRQDKCLPMGLLDVTDCYYGFPIALSYPHFMDSDPTLLEKVDGSHPDPEVHTSYFNIQPMSGLPVNLSVKLQINMAMGNVNNMNNVEQFSNLVVPMLWFDITMLELPPGLQDRFNLYLNILPFLDKFTFWLLLLGGSVCLLAAVTRTAIRLSHTISPNKGQKLSANRLNYSTILRESIVYKPCEEKFIEMQTRTSIHIENEMCDIDLTENKKFMLEEEPVMSDDQSDYDEGNDSDFRGSESINDENSSQTTESAKSNRVSENNSFSSGFASKEPTSSIISWELGPTSSSIDDIANMNFTELKIVEENDECENEKLLEMASSEISLSTILDRAEHS